MPGKNKIMVVDDDAITRNIVKLIFINNFELLEAENGKDALELLNSFRQELVLIICDISMPVMDGFEFLEEKRKHTYNNGIPVIMITSVSDTDIRQRAICLGAADFVDKPLDPEVVRLRVNNVLSNYGVGYAYNDALQRQFLDLINNQFKGGPVSIYERRGYPIHYISESLAVHLGYEDAAEMTDALDGKWSSLFSEEELERVLKEIREQLKEKGMFVHEYRLRKKNGDYVWMRENGKYSEDSTDGKKIIALCVDITDIKNAEEKARYNEKLAEIALDSTSISIWEYDFKTKSIIQGHNSVEVHGLDMVVPNIPESLIESEYVHPDSAQEFVKMYEELSNGAEKAEGIFKIRNAGGDKYWHEHIRYTNTFDDDGMPYRAIGISSDVTEQVSAVEQYQREMNFNKELSEDIFLATRINLTKRVIEEIHTDVETDKKLFENATFDNMKDVAAEDPCIGRDIKELLYKMELEEVIDAYNSGKRTITYEFLKEINDGPTWVRLELHMTKDPYNNDLIMFQYLRNIDQQYREVQRLKELAMKDGMTGLYNHDTTIEKVKECISEYREGQIHAMFIIDINKFKSINDCYGHMQGDYVLIQVAERINSVFRGDDIVGRIGGDEFMVLMKSIPTEAMAGRKMAELKNVTSFVVKNYVGDIKVQCSIGVALYKDYGMEFGDLYKQADEEMYKAKKEAAEKGMQEVSL